MENQKFDFEQAKALQQKLKGRIETVDGMLNKMQTTVNGVRAWWKGGSEEGFIRNFETTRKQIRKGLQEWLRDYEKLTKDIATAQRKSEDDLTKALKN